MMSKWKILRNAMDLNNDIEGFVVQVTVGEHNRLHALSRKYPNVITLEALYSLFPFRTSYLCFGRFGSRVYFYKRYRRKYRRHILVTLDTFEELLKEIESVNNGGSI